MTPAYGNVFTVLKRRTVRRVSEAEVAAILAERAEEKFDAVFISDAFGYPVFVVAVVFLIGGVLDRSVVNDTYADFAEVVVGFYLVSKGVGIILVVVLKVNAPDLGLILRNVIVALEVDARAAYRSDSVVVSVVALGNTVD